MELIINKFAELSNRSFTTPIAIVGDNGVGKTSTMNAYLWCLTGKGKDGYDMNEAVYSVNDSLTERKADVEVVLNGTHFHKVCCSIPLYKKGAGLVGIKSACSNTFYINDVQVTKAAYEAEVNQLCQGKPFGLFTDIQYFSRLPKDKQTEIFVEMLNINKNKFFCNLRDYQEIKADLKAVVNTIERNATLIEGFSSELQKTAIPTDFSSKIAEIKAKMDEIQSQRPTLSESEIAENNSINEQIYRLQNWSPKPILKEKSQKLAEIQAKFSENLEKRNNLVNQLTKAQQTLAELKKALRKAENDAENCEQNAEIQALKDEIEVWENRKKKDAELLENYAVMMKEARCNKCPQCDNLFCENKVTDLPTEQDLRDNIMKALNGIAERQSKLADLRDEFEQMTNNTITTLSSQIREVSVQIEAIPTRIKELEDGMVELRNQEKAAEDEAAEEIRQNDLISAENRRIMGENEVKIAEFKQKLHVPQIATFDNKMWSLKAQLTDYEAKQKVYDEVFGHRKGLADSIEKLSQTNSELTMKRVDYERELIAWESADKRYRDELTEKANEMLPEGMRLSLFRPLITGDGYVSEFAITYDSKRYKNTALQIWGDYQLTKVLQKGFGVNLPIFIDDVANIVDDKLLPKGEDVILIVAVKDLPLYYQKPEGII